ncbi:MAG: hypothetical protein ACOY3K_03220 [Candidatus Omnitrophota bacterium]
MEKLDTSLIKTHPLRFVSSKRLDLICKYMYFSEIFGDSNPINSAVERLYEKHILCRTCGIEPKDIWGSGSVKKSIEDYKIHAKRLLQDLRINGFHNNAPIPYYSNGLIANGAHRVAAALMLDIPVFAKLVGLEGGETWDFEWFVINKFSTEELQRILYTYAQLKQHDVVIFVLYSPAEEFWHNYECLINQRLNIVGSIELQAPNQVVMYDLIHDLYATTDVLSSHSLINRKALLLAMEKSLKIRVVLAERKSYLNDIYRTSIDIKNICRNLSHRRVSRDSF